MQTSETIGKLADALAKAQAEIKGAAKDKENPHFKASYATLDSVWEACREPLTKNGLAIVQVPGSDEAGNIVLETRLVHSSGEWVGGAVAVKPGKADAQAAGSVITYLRRYTLAAFAGVAPADDDGESGVGRGNGHSPEVTPVKTGNGQRFGGPLTITELKKQMRAFAGDVASCADYDSLVGLLNKSTDLLAQCARDLPDWWNGVEGTDSHGAAALIETRKKELASKEAA